jgi:hypothetical protein
MELADDLLENNSVTYLELDTTTYTKCSVVCRDNGQLHAYQQALATPSLLVQKNDDR